MAAGTTNMADATTLLTTPAASAIGPTARTRPASRAGTVLSAISGTDPPPTPRTAPRPRRAGRHRAPDTIRATRHRRLQAAHQLAVEVPVGRRDELVLVGKVMIDETHRHAGLGADGADR